MASIETFADFLRRNGHEVKTELTSDGERYTVDGESFPYKGVGKTKFAGLHKKYLLRNNA
ncbi:hypothetical protein [Salmonella enterica]|uniref:hypothetical protein n=1 Tax=Salmonella enterica TaxID=28901 RepID=UPI0021E377E9|nr:hypothetical protein [Salmonella enterica]